MHRRDKAGKMIVVVNVLPDLSGRFRTWMTLSGGGLNRLGVKT